MTKLIITRHGFSAYNLTRQYTGQKDVPLTELGQKQADRTAEYVAENFKIDAIYSSDLIRAVSTALPLSEKLGLPLIKEPLIKEIYGGVWEDLTSEEINERYHDDWQVYLDTIGLARCTGGESLVELQERSLRGMKKIAEENDGKTVFVATHGGVLLTLSAAWYGIPAERMHESPSPSNSSLTTVIYDNGTFTVEDYGNDEHLGELKVANDMQQLR